jgi:hypothetical protein
MAGAHYPTVFKVSYQHFVATFTRKHKPSHAAELVLSDKTHTLHERSLARFLALPRDMLWMRASTHMISTNIVVRKRFRRRLEGALYDALRDIGLDVKGILWRGNRAGMSKQPEEKKREGLTGTVELSAQQSLMLAEWGEVKKQVGLVAEKLKMTPERRDVGRQVKKAVQRKPREREEENSKVRIK